MLAAKRYLALSIDLTVSSSSIFRAVSSEGAQRIFGLETWRVTCLAPCVLRIRRLYVLTRVHCAPISVQCTYFCRKVKGCYQNESASAHHGGGRSLDT